MRDFIRIVERWLQETPIADIDIRGDLDVQKTTTFDPMDKKLLKNPKWQPKVFKAFTKTPRGGRANSDRSISGKSA